MKPSDFITVIDFINSTIRVNNSDPIKRKHPMHHFNSTDESYYLLLKICGDEDTYYMIDVWKFVDFYDECRIQDALEDIYFGFHDILTGYCNLTYEQADILLANVIKELDYESN